MSYILDALKKSEQQRSHGSVPDVRTIHSSSLNYKHDKKSLWPYFLIIAVTLNFIAIVYFIFDRETTVADIKAASPEVKPTAEAEQLATTLAAKEETYEQTKAQTSNRETVTAAHKTTNITAIQAPQKTAVAPVPGDNNINEPDVEPARKLEQLSLNNSSDNNTSIPNAEIIDFYELDDSIKNELPAIIISAHVYSTNPVQRSIVINNNFMEEGEYLLDDIVLYEITKEGAIFNYHGTLFHYRVVSSWQ